MMLCATIKPEMWYFLPGTYRDPLLLWGVSNAYRFLICINNSK